MSINNKQEINQQSIKPFDSKNSNPLFNPSPNGTHFLIELFGCDSKQLNDLAFIKSTLIASLDKTGIDILDLSEYQFQPHGVSVVLLLSASHMSIHTWPEHKYCTIDIFTCTEQATSEIITKKILTAFTNTKHKMTTINRGYLQ